MLDENYEWDDFTEVELKEFFLGYKSNELSGKAGIIDVKTPGKTIYSGDEAGLQLKYSRNGFDLKAFYTQPNLIDDSLEVLDDFSDLSHLTFSELEYDQLFNTDINLWSAYYQDNNEKDFPYYSMWYAAEVNRKINNLEINLGYIYNTGEVTTLDIPISAHMMELNMELGLSKTSGLFTKVISIGNSDSSDTINQFQYKLR